MCIYNCCLLFFFFLNSILIVYALCPDMLRDKIGHDASGKVPEHLGSWRKHCTSKGMSYAHIAFNCISYFYLCLIMCNV